MSELGLLRHDVDEPRVVTPARWRQLITDIYAPIRVDHTEDSFSGQIRNHDVDGIHISRIRVGAHRTQRVEADIRPADQPKLVLCVQLSGHGVVSQAGRFALLEPGDITVYNTNAPYELIFDGDAECMGVVIPWGALPEAPATLRHLAARVIPHTDPVIRAVVRSIVSIEPELAIMPPRARRRFVHHIVDMIATVCAAENERALISGEGGIDDEALRRALSYIELHLSEPELSVEMVAAENFVSVRRLQALATRNGFGLASWIRTRRLEKCRMEILSSPDRLISDIALSGGFATASHFAHLFRGTYGLTPREYRQHHARVLDGYDYQDE